MKLRNISNKIKSSLDFFKFNGLVLSNKQNKELMDFDIIEKKLKEIFKTNSVEYQGKNSRSDFLQFSIILKKMTPKINANWTKNFPSGSYYGIRKSVNTKRFGMQIDISKNDYDNFFRNKPYIILKNQRVILKDKKQ